MTSELIAIALTVITGLLVATLFGFYVGRGRRTPIHTDDIMNYVRENFGSEYDAYRKGISEGYQQGLRDAELGDGT